VPGSNTTGPHSTCPSSGSRAYTELPVASYPTPWLSVMTKIRSSPTTTCSMGRPRSASHWKAGVAGTVPKRCTPSCAGPPWYVDQATSMSIVTGGAVAAGPSRSAVWAVTVKA